MRNLKYVLVFGLVLMIFAGCSREEIQPDPLNTADDISLKGAKAQHEEGDKDHYVPFKARFELSAIVNRMGPITQLDYQTDWLVEDGVIIGGMHVDIVGNGNATHLGRTEFTIYQWWSQLYPYPGLLPKDSYGQGEITFTAANGDELWATYYGTADHQDDPPTEILTNGIFKGGTGKFEDAEGKFLWDGLFVKTLVMPPMPTGGEILGTGTVTVTGYIKY